MKKRDTTRDGTGTDARHETASDAPFLSRWSRLKRAQAEALPGNSAPENIPPVDSARANLQGAGLQGADGESDTAQPAPRTDEEVLEELGLPDPDTLGPQDDFSGFMAKAVPERLRNRALRKLWLSNPVLANLDELVDYGEDFTDAATVIENLQTVYRVGKGMLPDPVDPEEEADTIAEAAEGAPADPDDQQEATGDPRQEEPDADDATLEETSGIALAETADAPADQTTPAALQGQAMPMPDHGLQPVDDLPPPRPRRMKFLVGDV